LGSSHYPVWDDQNLVHFIGHSTGAQVVRVLHHMLADKVHTERFSNSVQKLLLFVAGWYCAHAYHMLPEGWFLWSGVLAQDTHFGIASISVLDNLRLYQSTFVGTHQSVFSIDKSHSRAVPRVRGWSRKHCWEIGFPLDSRGQSGRRGGGPCAVAEAGDGARWKKKGRRAAQSCLHLCFHIIFRCSLILTPHNFDENWENSAFLGLYICTTSHFDICFTGFEFLTGIKSTMFDSLNITDFSTSGTPTWISCYLTASVLRICFVVVCFAPCRG
jgi:hypothetical protein